jgi:biopolymer transport protein TolQ
LKEAWAVTSVDLSGNFHGSLVSMVLNAGLMVKFVLVLLLAFSVVSWAIILMKHRVINRTQKENDRFLDAYMRSNRLSEVAAESKKFRNSSIAEVFRSGYSEFGKVSWKKQEVKPIDMDDSGIGALELRGIDNVERALNRACGTEASKLEKALGFLATTGSACPFIGLFGTVWGIMTAFQDIGARGSATLAVVAPGISEALIATAGGLAAAIPAVIFYNYYLNKVRAISLEMESFASEFLNIIERNYVKSSKP